MAAVVAAVAVVLLLVDVAGRLLQLHLLVLIPQPSQRVADRHQALLQLGGEAAPAVRRQLPVGEAADVVINRRFRRLVRLAEEAS